LKKPAAFCSRPSREEVENILTASMIPVILTMIGLRRRMRGVEKTYG
jgi:hypothetical protein